VCRPSYGLVGEVDVPRAINSADVSTPQIFSQPRTHTQVLHLNQMQRGAQLRRPQTSKHLHERSVTHVTTSKHLHERSVTHVTTSKHLHERSATSYSSKSAERRSSSMSS
jgi:hypothetical protein